MKISVIIPVYNAEKYLNKCLDSVINQTYEKWEVIAIDDGSCDKSLSILNEYSKLDSRIKVHTQKNQGPGMTRNNGIKYSNGDYLVFLDSDDYIEDYYFEELKICVENNDSDVVFIDLVQEDSKGKILKNELMSKYKEKDKDTIIRHQMTGKLPWGGCRKAVRKSLIENNNIEYSIDTVGEEALFSFRVLYSAKVISFIDRVCYHYINHPNSQSKKGDIDPWGDICKKLKKYLLKNKLIENYSDTINSFGITALTVSIYRISNNTSLKNALKLTKLAIQDFESNYSFNLDVDSLETRVKCMVPFIKSNSILPILLIGKVKQLMN